ncbi:MAG: adenine phosphoribosyltransferase [Acidobacteriota bacterium]
MDDLKASIREVPDFPKPGILFYDITTLLKDPVALRKTVDRFAWLYIGHEVDKVVGTESRGFLFAPLVALSLNAGFVPVRKPGKLPGPTLEVSYELEYGTDTLQMHEDAIDPGEKTLVVDDLLATGGTARATIDLCERAGGEVVGCGFIVELTFLGGREALAPHPVDALLQYDE